MSTTTLKENKMGVMPVGKLLANMALPMIISMLVQALYNVVDSIYVSQISESAVTALSLAFPVQNMQIGFAVGIGVGVNSLLSKSLGQKDQESANRTAGNGIVLMLIALGTGLLKTEAVKEVSSFLTGIMPILFVPPAVRILEYWGIVGPSVAAIVIICVSTTILVFAVSGLITQGIMKKGGKGNG